MEIWQNGYWQIPDATNRLFGSLAFQYGFGVFETLLVREGFPADVDDHIQRMLQSIQTLDAAAFCPLDAWQLKENILLALRNRQAEKEVLKITAYREADRWSFLFALRPYPYRELHYKQGFSLTKSSYLRNPHSLLVYHKTMNYLENYVERQAALCAGYHDAYFLNPDGIVTECTSANLFIVLQGELITSPVTSGMLPGTMRQKLLHKAGEMGVTAKEFPVCPEMLQKAEAVVVTNALYGAIPVFKIDATNYPVNPVFIQRLNEVLGRRPD